MTWAVETHQLTKQFPALTGWGQMLRQKSGGTVAVKDVDLNIAQGELFGLLGPNGAGKTTLIKLLSTLIVPTSGTAWINGYPLSQASEIKANLGLVTSDERSFYWRLTGRQNLGFFANLYQIPAYQIADRIEQVLNQVGLTAVANTRFLTYSTGMRQRLSIARALLHQPGILFLDEPTKGLDPTATQQLHLLIREQLMSRQGMTILLTTHDLREAETLCDRIAIMHHGRIRACGTLVELRHELDFRDLLQVHLSGLTGAEQESIQRVLPDLLVSKASSTNQLSGDTPDLSVLELPITPGGSELKQILEAVQATSAILHKITTRTASIDTIYSRFTQDNEEGTPPLPEQAAPLKASSLPLSVISRELKTLPDRQPERITPLAFYRLATAFLRRDFFNEVSYRFSFLLQFANILFSVGVFYFVSELIGPAANPYLSQYGGDYFSFVLIGIAFAGYFGVGLSSFSNSLRQSQITGTLEAMLSTPTSLSIIILGSSLWDYLLTTLRVVIYLLVGGLFLGVNLSLQNLPAAVVILFLTVITFSSLGILSASFIMVLKRGDPINWAFNAFSTLLGGVYYPIEILPGWLRWISHLIPVTYALEGMRKALLQSASFAEIIPEIVALVVFSVILLPLSLLAFRTAVRRARIEGSLTHY